MSDSASPRRAGANLVAAAAALVLVALVAVWQRQAVAGFFVANPALNGLILVVFGAGVIYGFARLARVQREFAFIDDARRRLDEARGTPAAAAGLLDSFPDSFVGQRLRLYRRQSARGQRPDAAAHAETLVATLDLHAGVTRYIAGLLVFLGLLGTFVGLLMSLGAIENLVGGLRVDPGEDLPGFLDSLKDGLRGPLRGMATAFSTSVFGLVASLVMGFIHLQLASAQTRYLAAFDDFDDETLRPAFDAEAEDAARAAPVHAPVAAVAGGGLTEPVARYLEASQRQLKENLDRLVEIVERTENMQADYRETLGALSAEIETVNTAIGRLSTNQELVREAIGRVADHARVGEEQQRLAAGELKAIAETLARLGAGEQAARKSAEGFYKDILAALRREMGVADKLRSDRDGQP